MEINVRDEDEDTDSESGIEADDREAEGPTAAPTGPHGIFLFITCPSVK